MLVEDWCAIIISVGLLIGTYYTAKQGMEWTPLAFIILAFMLLGSVFD